jgi:type IV pilus assembly protein PilX
MLHRPKQKPRFGPNPEQSGMILVLAMSMLFIMSIIGIMALNTSSTEIGISGNHKSSQEAFFAADRAVEYGMVNGEIYNAIGTGTQVTFVRLNEGVHLTRIAAGMNGSGLKEDEEDDEPTENQVTFLYDGPLPPGSGSDPTYFGAMYFTIGVTSQGPKNTETRIESQVARIRPL